MLKTACFFVSFKNFLSLLLKHLCGVFMFCSGMFASVASCEFAMPVGLHGCLSSELYCNSRKKDPMESCFMVVDAPEELLGG